MKRIVSVLGFVFVLSFALQAQPGYLGKTFKVGYFLEGINSTKFANATGQSGYLDFNYSHTAQLEKAINRKQSVLLEYQLGQTGVHSNENAFFSSYSSMGLYSKLLLEHQSVNLLMRRYFVEQGALAPVGKYGEYGIGLQQVKVLDRTDNHDYFTFQNALLSIGAGRSRVLFNRLVVDMNLNFTLTIPLGSERLSPEARQELDQRYPEDSNYAGDPAIASDSRLRMISLQAVNLKVGISGLLF